MTSILPGFARELEAALRDIDEHFLASEVALLRIRRLCSCSDSFCSSFYTAYKPEGAWGPGHRTVLPDVSDGMVILDVVDDVIRYVEIIDRDDVHSLLADLKPWLEEDPDRRS